MLGGCINSKEFENIAEIYDMIRTWNTMSQGNVPDQQLAQQFDNELKIVMKNITQIEKQSDQHQELLRQSNCIGGLERLYSLCHLTMLDLINDRELSDLLKCILAGKDDIAQRYKSLVRQAAQMTEMSQFDSNSEIESLRK